MAFTIDGTTGIATVDGSVSAPSQRGQDTNSGISYGADSIKFSTGGVERMAITNSGVTGAGGGKVLQLKYAVKNNTTSLSSVTTPSEVSSDLRVTITPTSGSSLMIVTANLFQSKLEGDNTSYRMYKSSSTNMSSPSFVQSASTINGSQDGNLNIIFDNSGGTPRSNLAVLLKVFEVAGNTNERTYSPFWCITGGTTYLNSYAGGGYFGTSGMTVMEVDIS